MLLFVCNFLSIGCDFIPSDMLVRGDSLFRDMPAIVCKNNYHCIQILQSKALYAVLNCFSFCSISRTRTSFIAPMWNKRLRWRNSVSDSGDGELLQVTD